jgi:hypothetical protein
LPAICPMKTSQSRGAEQIVYDCTLKFELNWKQSVRTARAALAKG